MYAIEARGLTKTFKNFRAVDGIDVLVESGDVVGLLGPNGAGKTTTIMMLLGITEPDAGDVRLLGHPLPAERTQALQRVNFWASYLGLPGRMRVREVLDIYRQLYGASKARAAEVAELLGLGPLLGRFTTELSSGQKTLIGLAKSLVNRPSLLVLDEPTASLDPEVATRVRDVILALHAEEKFTLLITSHNMDEIERLCRRVVFIANGRTVADGSPSEIATQFGAEDLEETFLTIAAGRIEVKP
jgi:ABC-2 type transport system ATP-binding protein